MIETTVKVDGMMCGMCEAHVSDAIRGALPVKKVTASHTKGQAVILSEAPLDEEALRAAIGNNFAQNQVARGRLIDHPERYRRLTLIINKAGPPDHHARLRLKG